MRTKALGRCAYPKCPFPGGEVRVGFSSSDSAPVAYGEGFYEIRLQGGAHAYWGGVRPTGVPWLNGVRNAVWHKACAIKHRRECEEGEQGAMFE
jgi:hypothetical protein